MSRMVNSEEEINIKKIEEEKRKGTKMREERKEEEKPREKREKTLKRTLFTCP